MMNIKLELQLMTIWHQLSDFGEEIVSWNYYKQRGLQASKSIPYTSVSSQFFLPLVFSQQFSVRSFPAIFPAKLRRPFQRVLHPSLDSFNSQYIPFPFYFEFLVVIQCQRISGNFPAKLRRRFRRTEGIKVSQIRYTFQGSVYNFISQINYVVCFIISSLC